MEAVVAVEQIVGDQALQVGGRDVLRRGGRLRDFARSRGRRIPVFGFVEPSTGIRISQSRGVGAIFDLQIGQFGGHQKGQKPLFYKGKSEKIIGMAGFEPTTS